MIRSILDKYRGYTNLEIIFDDNVDIVKSSTYGEYSHMKPYLKWAGGKYRQVENISAVLPSGKRLIEPFVGAGSVFLNLNYQENILCDTNVDLINLHNNIKNIGPVFTEMVREYFTPENNTEESYYKLRKQFNESTDTIERSCLFLYLNRHCYNGLCRYNSSGGYNVPFGKYKSIYFPEKELNNFHEKAKNSTFITRSFEETIGNAQFGDVIYCDPPYVPLSDVNFTYTGTEFGINEQKLLVECAINASKLGALVVISNHDCDITRDLYKDANKIIELNVQRNISCGTRGKAKELMVIYGGNF